MSSFRRRTQKLPSQVTKPVLIEIKGEKSIDKVRAEALLTKFINTSEAISSAIPGSDDPVVFSNTGFSSNVGTNPKIGQLKRVQRELRGLPPLLAELDAEYLKHDDAPQNKKVVFDDEGEAVTQNKKIKFDSEEPEEIGADAEAEAVEAGDASDAEVVENTEVEKGDVEMEDVTADLEATTSKKRKLEEDAEGAESTSKRLKKEKKEKKEKKDKKEKKEKK